MACHLHYHEPAKDPTNAEANIVTALLQEMLHQPGIEPGSEPWQGIILPLDHWCFDDLVNHI